MLSSGIGSHHIIANAAENPFFYHGEGEVEKIKSKVENDKAYAVRPISNAPVVAAQVVSVDGEEKERYIERTKEKLLEYTREIMEKKKQMVGGIDIGDDLKDVMVERLEENKGLMLEKEEGEESSAEMVADQMEESGKKIEFDTTTVRYR
jgi:hypothetical protein